MENIWRRTLYTTEQQLPTEEQVVLIGIKDLTATLNQHMTSDQGSNATGHALQSVLLYGYYGEGNVGDEAILSVLIKQIREFHSSSVNITALSLDSEYTRSLHEDLDCVVPRISLKEIHTKSLYHIYDSDEVWFGGGGTLSGVRFLNHSFLILLARVLGTDVRLVAVGACDIHDGLWQRRLLKWMLYNVQVVSVRNKSSVDNLRSVGFDGKIIEVKDPVFSFECGKENSDLSKSKRNSQDSSVLMVSVRSPINRTLDQRELADALDKIVDYTNCSILFLPFNNNTIPSDYDVSLDVMNKMESSADVFEGELDHIQACNKIAHEADAVLGMRLHSIIIAAANEVPFVGISYHPKCEEHLRLLGVNEVNWCDELDTDELATQVIRIVNTKSMDKKSIQKIDQAKKSSERVVSEVSNVNLDPSWINILPLIIFFFINLFIHVLYKCVNRINKI